MSISVQHIQGNYIIDDSSGQIYTETVKFEALKERAERLSSFSVGDMVEVGFALSGRIWNPPEEPVKKVYFNSLKAVTIQLLEKREATPSETAPQETSEAGEAVFNKPLEDGDLPF